MSDSFLSGTNLKHAGDHNLRVTLQAIRLNGPVSRAELAQMTGLTPQTIAYISKKLIAKELVIETGRRSGYRGQPATEIVINPDGGYSIGVNIDRDHLTVILIDLSGAVRARKHVETNFFLPDEAFAWIKDAYHDVLEENKLSKEDLTGVGLAIPFKLGYRRLSQTPESFAAWQDYPAGSRLEEIVGVSVHEENDATAASIGEAQYGHGVSIQSFFYLFIGYGLGGGLVIDGNYVHGYDGHSGEIGHIPLAGLSARSRSTNLQDKVSLSTLYTSLEQAGIKASNPGDLVGVLDNHPGKIREWLDSAADHLLPQLIAISCVINPGAIFIGGRLPEPLIEILIEALEKRIDPIRDELPSTPPILRAKTLADAAVLGAAIVPFAKTLFPAHDVLMKKPNRTESRYRQKLATDTTTDSKTDAAYLKAS